MNEQMEFPKTFEDFAKEYGFKDDKEVYTNGSDLIPIFRVKQWLEHDNKLRTIETDTAYDCGKYANKWIPVSERLPKANGRYLVTRGLNACDSIWNRVYIINYSDLMGLKSEKIWWDGNVGKSDFEQIEDVLAWKPLSEPYKAESEEFNG